MGNEQFNDVGVLNTLASLQRTGMLHDEDRRELVERLSQWGKEQAVHILTPVTQNAVLSPAHLPT
jgi:hypothetical protein